jgi:hypothetical protein
MREQRVKIINKDYQSISRKKDKKSYRRVKISRRKKNNNPFLLYLNIFAMSSNQLVYNEEIKSHDLHTSKA